MYWRFLILLSLLGCHRAPPVATDPDPSSATAPEPMREAGATLLAADVVARHHRRHHVVGAGPVSPPDPRIVYCQEHATNWSELHLCLDRVGQ